jgi:hypothetical protein
MQHRVQLSHLREGRPWSSHTVCAQPPTSCWVNLRGSVGSGVRDSISPVSMSTIHSCVAAIAMSAQARELQASTYIERGQRIVEVLRQRRSEHANHEGHRRLQHVNEALARVQLCVSARVCAVVPAAPRGRTSGTTGMYTCSHLKG